MFKKIVLTSCFLLGIVSMSFSGITGKVLVPLQVEVINPTTTHTGHPRNPIEVPDICQDSHILYFNNVDYDLELVLLDEDGEEVYSTLVTAGTSAVVLPSTLTGDYELQLYPGGDYYFYSDITL